MTKTELVEKAIEEINLEREREVVNVIKERVQELEEMRKTLDLLEEEFQELLDENVDIINSNDYDI